MTEAIVPEIAIERFEDRQPAIPPATAPMTSSDLLSILVQRGADLATLEKFLELKDRDEANQARKQYIVAVTNFKKKPLEILKDKKVSFKTQKGTTAYDHASLANIVNVISAELGNHGLSASWKTEQGDFGIRVTCILQHIAGHNATVSLTAPPDPSGTKNPIQAIASTISYLERYTLLAITGLTTTDMDTDGILPKTEEPITDQMAIDIPALQKKAGITDKDFADRLQKKFKAKTIDELSSVQAGELIRALEVAVDAKK